MTTSTIKDPPPETKAPAVNEPPGARKAQSEPAVPRAGADPDLESRIKLRRTELIEKLGEIRADPRLATAEVRDQLKAKLSELAHIIKMGVVDGWASLGDSVQHKLENWLVESERPVATDQVAKSGQS